MGYPMTDDALDRQVGEFFARHIRSRPNVDDIKALEPHLADEPALLRGLGSRCLEEGRKAMRAGQHMEGRRLDILARQLQQRAGDAAPLKRP